LGHHGGAPSNTDDLTDSEPLERELAEWQKPVPRP
jgi:hypothetical protein